MEKLNKKREQLMEAAIVVFTRDGIENAKLSDIAREAGVGIATLYRHFNDKPTLVLKAAELIWQRNMPEEEIEREGRTGYARIEKMISSYMEVFQRKKDYLRFVEEFDGYVVKEGIPSESLMEYEGIIMRLRDRAKSAFDDGVRDGSIRGDLDFELWYMTIGRSLMALAQKLALRGHILSYDETVDDKAQMACMIDMVMRYLK